MIGTLAVAAIWFISAGANWWAGTLLAKDPAMSHILGAASVACDVLKAVALFVVMGAIANKRWVVMATAMVLFGLCTAWSLRSAAYFAADAITEKVATVETSNALSMAKLQVIDAKTRRAQFLAEQKVTVAGTRGSRQDAIQANRQASAEFSGLTADLERDIQKLEESKQVLKASTDPLADLLQVDRQVTILATAMFFALLMELASSTGFWLIARASTRPVPTVPGVPSVPERSESQETVGKPPETPLAILPDVSPPPAQELPLSAMDLATETEFAYQAPIESSSSNVVRLEFVDQDTRRLREAVRDTLEISDPEDRVLLSTLAKEVSRRLPKGKAVTGRSGIVYQLTPALTHVWPNLEKKRASGQTWVYGCRLRPLAESANG